MTDKVIVLAGGVGAAKFIDGLRRVVNPEKLIIIVNTGDDIDLFGLKICPDIDIITYTLAGLVDKDKGWGFQKETFNSLEILKRYYNTGWFNLGDKDLATHIFRTDLFKQGHTKSEITSIISKKLGIKSKILPMCNEPVVTRIITPTGSMHFEEFYIKYKCRLTIKDVVFEGIEKSYPVDNILDEIKKAEKIIISPSNPIVSIGTILKVNDFKEALVEVREKVYGISPIIEGKTIKGPADKLMECLGYKVSSLGVASIYQEFLNHFIIDDKDCRLKPKIEELGMNCYTKDTIMTSVKKKRKLAEFIINL